MQEFIDKLISRLEECQKETLTASVRWAYKKAIKIAKELAEEYKHCIKSSCSNCEVYDKEKHYCPKWCEVIKHTTEELAEENQDLIKNNQGWIPCSEELPPQPEENPEFENKPLELYLVSMGSGYPWRAFWNGEFFTDGWSRVEPKAWMPLPTPYKGE